MPGTPCIEGAHTDLSTGGDHFHDIVAALPAALYATSADGRITYYNEAAAEFWGRRPVLGEDQWCGSWRLYWPDGAPMRHEDCPMAVAIRTGRPVRGAAAIVERPDGVRSAFMPFPTPFLDPDGELTGAFNVLIPLPGPASTAAPAARRLSLVSGPEARPPSAALPGPLDVSTASLFDQVARLVHRPDVGIDPFGWAILRCLSRSRMTRDRSYLAAYVGIAESAVARQITSLVRQGLVARAGLPGPSERTSLTPHGRRKLMRDPLHLLARAIVPLGETGRASFARELERVVDHLIRIAGAD